MSWGPEIAQTIKRLAYIKTSLKELFTGRDHVVDLLVLAAVCREHMLLIGPPGTAKTELISRFCQQIDSEAYHYLLTRFTEPSELFGPLDVEEFQKGRYRIRTQGMMPTARFAFLDEVFQGSSAILNALLALINERVFFNGAERQNSPLISLIGASNALPDDPWLQAFADRFVLRLEVGSCGPDRLDDLLDRGWALEQEREQGTRAVGALKADELLRLNKCIVQVGIGRVKAEYAEVIRELHSESVEVSDRRIVKGLKLIAGAAVLRGATEAQQEDLWPVLHMWNRPEEAETIRRVLEPRLAGAGVAAGRVVPTEQDIQFDLDALNGVDLTVRSEAAIGAHLRQLSDLRRAAMVHYPKVTSLRQNIDDAIKRTFGMLEVSNV